MNGSASGSESSVLFSLRELRDIESRRVADERAAAKAAQDAEIRARAAEVARVAAEREAAEQARRAAAEQALADRHKKLEEDALRVRETEARLRAEALVKIETDRLAYEVELRREEIARKRPRWLMGVAAGCAALALGVGLLAVRASDEAKANNALAIEAEARAKAARDDLAAEKARIAELGREIKKQEQLVASAKTEIEKKKAEAELIRLKGKRPHKKPGGGSGGSGGGSGGSGGVITVKCTDGVLCD